MSDNFDDDDILKQMSKITGVKAEMPRPPAQTVDIQPLLEKVRGGVSGQESGGNTKAVNGRTRATGEFQVLPSNIPAWTRKHLKREMGVEEFKNNPQAQRQVFDAEFGGYLTTALKRSGGDEDKAIRMAAAAWYGGEGAMHRYDDAKRFRPNEPSFKEYTEKVLQRTKGQKAQPSVNYDNDPILASMQKITKGFTPDFDANNDPVLAEMQQITAPATVAPVENDPILAQMQAITGGENVPTSPTQLGVPTFKPSPTNPAQIKAPQIAPLPSAPPDMPQWGVEGQTVHQAAPVQAPQIERPAATDQDYADYLEFAKTQKEPVLAREEFDRLAADKFGSDAGAMSVQMRVNPMATATAQNAAPRPVNVTNQTPQPMTTATGEPVQNPQQLLDVAPTNPALATPRDEKPTTVYTDFSKAPRTGSLKQFANENIANHVASTYGIPVADVMEAQRLNPVKSQTGEVLGEDYYRQVKDEGAQIETQITPALIKKAREIGKQRTAGKKAVIANLIASGDDLTGIDWNELNSQGIYIQDVQDALTGADFAEAKGIRETVGNAKAQGFEAYQKALLDTGQINESTYQQNLANEREAKARAEAEIKETTYSPTQGNIAYSDAAVYKPKAASIEDFAKDNQIFSYSDFYEQQDRETQANAEAWKKVASSPGTVAVEFTKNLARSVPKAVSNLSKVVSIAAEGIDSVIGGDQTRATERGFYQLGKWIDRQTDSWLPQDKVLRRNFLTTTLPDTFGQLLVQLAVGAGTGGVAAPLAIGASSGSVAAYEEADRFNAGRGTRLLSAFVGGLAAAPDAIPFAKWLKPLTTVEKAGFLSKFLNSFAGKAAAEVGEAEAQSAARLLGKNILIGGGLEGTQETFENKINDGFAALTYDPKRKVLTIDGEDVESFLAGIIGGTAGGTVETMAQMPVKEYQSGLAQEYAKRAADAATPDAQTDAEAVSSKSEVVSPQPTDTNVAQSKPRVGFEVRRDNRIEELGYLPQEIAAMTPAEKQEIYDAGVDNPAKIQKPQGELPNVSNTAARTVTGEQTNDDRQPVDSLDNPDAAATALPDVDGNDKNVLDDTTGRAPVVEAGKGISTGNEQINETKTTPVQDATLPDASNVLPADVAQSADSVASPSTYQRKITPEKAQKVKARAAALFAKKEPLKMIVGEQGVKNLPDAKVRQQNLTVAQEMEAAGKDAKTIYLATGWEKGADGKYKNEIDDSQAKLLIGNRGDSKKQVNDLFSQFHSENNDAKKKEILSQIKELEKNDYVLSEVIDYPQLFKAYPQLANTKVQVVQFQDSYGRSTNFNGTYNQKTNVISLSDALKNDELKSTVLHETQHAVQKIEKFALGGTSQMFEREDASLEYAWLRELKQKSKEMPDATVQDVADALIKDYKKFDLEDMIPSPEVHLKVAANMNNDEYVNRIKAIAMATSSLTETPQEKYLRLGGEVEARNVQSRMNMSAEERANTPFTETEDILREKQIILKKISTANNTDTTPLRELAARDLADIAESDIEAETSGDTVTLSLAAGEIVRTAESLINDVDRSQTAISKGQFLDESQVTQIADGLDVLAEAYADAGRSRAEIDSVRDAILEAARTNGTAKVIVYNEAIPHESLHQVDYLTATPEAKSLLTRAFGDVDNFIEKKGADGKDAVRDVVDTAYNSFFKQNGYANKTKMERAVIVQEISVYTQTGEGETLGLTPEQTARFIYHYLTGYVERNGVESIANFEAYYKQFNLDAGILGQIKNERTKEGISQNESGNIQTGDGQARARSDTSTDDSGDAQSSEKETDERKKRGVVKSLENRGYISEGDIVGEGAYYQQVNQNETQAEAERKVETLGLAAASAQAKTEVKKPSADDTAFRMAVSELLFSQAEAANKQGDGDLAALKMQEALEIVSIMAENATTRGQANAQLAKWTRSNPKTAAAYVQKRRVQNGFDQALTPEEASALTQAAEKAAKVQQTLEQVREDLADAQRQADYLENALQSQQQTVKADVSSLQRQLTYWKKKASGEIERRTSNTRKLTKNTRELYANLLENHQDLKQRLAERFGESVVLKMIAPLNDGQNPVLRKDAGKLAGSDFNDLVDFAALEILHDTPYDELIAKLADITGESATAQDIKDIHLEAYNVTHPARQPHVSLDSGKAAIRAKHTREATNYKTRDERTMDRATKAVEQDIKNQSIVKLSNFELEIIKDGDILNNENKDLITVAALLLERQKGIGKAEFVRLLRAENPNLSGADALAIGTAGAKLRGETRARLTEQSKKVRQSIETLGKQETIGTRTAGKTYQELIRRSDALEQPPPGYFRRLMGVKKSAMVSGVSTAAINFLGGQLGRKINTTTDLLELAINKGLAAANKPVKSETAISADTQFRDVLGYTGNLEGKGVAQMATRAAVEWFSATALANSQDSTAQRRYLSKAQQTLSAFPDENERLFGAYNSDITAHREITRKSFKDRGVAEKADFLVDNGLAAAEYAFDKANYLNKLQEFWIRDLEFARSLQKQLGGRGLKLDNIIEKGDWNKIKPQEVARAVDEALKITFAIRAPKNSVVGGITNFINRTPVLREIAPFIAPFPNFLYNAVDFTTDYVPGVGAIKQARRNQKAEDLSVLDSYKSLSSRDAAKAMIGTALFLTALAVVRNFGDDDDWKKLRVPFMKDSAGRPMYVDVSNWFPFTPFIFMANKFNRFISGKPIFIDADNAFGEMLEGLAGLSQRNMTENDLVNTLWQAKSALGSGDSKDLERLWYLARKFAGNEIGQFFRPLKVIKDTVTLFDSREQKQFDMADLPTAQGVTRNLPFANALNENVFGAAPKKRLTGEEMTTSAPLARMFGYNIQNSDYHREVPSRFLSRLKDLGFEGSGEKDPLPQAQRQRFYKGQLYQMIREAGVKQDFDQFYDSETPEGKAKGKQFSDKTDEYKKQGFNPMDAQLKAARDFGWLTPEQAADWKTKTEKRKQIKTVINQLVKDKVFTDKQLQRIESSIGLTELQATVKNLSANPETAQGTKFQDALRLATPEEMKEIKKVLGKKKGRPLTDDEKQKKRAPLEDMLKTAKDDRVRERIEKQLRDLE